MPLKKKSKSKNKGRKMNPDRKSNLLKVMGLVVAVFAALTLLSTVSYLFT